MITLKLLKCKNCSYKFDPIKEGNSKKRKCGMCCFGDSYSSPVNLRK